MESDIKLKYVEQEINEIEERLLQLNEMLDVLSVGNKQDKRNAINLLFEIDILIKRQRHYEMLYSDLKYGTHKIQISEIEKDLIDLYEKKSTYDIKIHGFKIFRDKYMESELSKINESIKEEELLLQSLRKQDIEIEKNNSLTLKM